MTREEHLLILTMLTRQQLLTKVILDLLRSREIVADDDVAAFEFAVRQDAASNPVLLRQVKEVYLTVASELGVNTGITPAE
jgi:hypothetical protein